MPLSLAACSQLYTWFQTARLVYLIGVQDADSLLAFAGLGAPIAWQAFFCSDGMDSGRHEPCGGIDLTQTVRHRGACRPYPGLFGGGGHKVLVCMR
jgi:hypothetical protein